MHPNDRDIKGILNNSENKEQIRGTLEHLEMESKPKLSFDYSLNIVHPWTSFHSFRVVLICFPSALNNSKKERLEELIEDAFRTLEES